MTSRPLSLPRAILACLLFSSLAAQAEESVSLAGKWRFSRDEAKKGLEAKWYAGQLKPSGDEPAEIALPGTTDEAKAGRPNTKKPDYEGLYRTNTYVGPAWYQREIEIPDRWQGKHVTLFLERNHWTNQVWLDDRDCGTQDSLVAPQVFDLGSGLVPGKHRLTLRVDNTIKYNLGYYASSVTDLTQTNWNGVIGAIELRAADPVAITGLQVYPDLAGKKIKVVAKIANLTGAAANGQLQLSVADANGKAQGSPATAAYSSSEAESTVTAEVPMGDYFKTWDEFAPNLYTVKAVLSANPSRSEQSAAFGMRQLAEQGTQFLLNGRPLMLRGTLECAIFPLTGHPPMDVDAWRRIYRIEKSYGLNFIRFHSWTPPEAAFTAADLEGIYIHTEGPQANIDTGDNPEREKFMEQELLRIVHTYGNHPSFILLAEGNEIFPSKPVGTEDLTHWIDELIAADPRHLYTDPTQGVQTPNRQWTESQEMRGVRGPSTMDDFRQTVAVHKEHPVVGHEIGQWAVYPNFDEMKKYTGVVAPKNFELIRRHLEAQGMLDQAPQFFQASGRLATLLYKEEIELMLRTPGLGGFSLLDLHDYPGQGTALIGILDPFWDSKGFITPDQHRRYDGPVVPLLRFPKRVYTPGEKFTAQAQLAQFGPADLEKVTPSWKIEDAAGRELASGTLPPTSAATGKLGDLGTITASLAKAEPPCQATVTVSLDGTPYSNSWNIWIYPPAAPVAPPADVVVAEEWAEAKAALAEGRKVILFPKRFDANKSRKNAFTPVFWAPGFHSYPTTMGMLCDPKHPLFAQFPTAFHSDWQWWNLLDGSRALVLDAAPKDYRPLVQVIDNFLTNQKLAAVFEASSGNGRLLVCTLPVYGAKAPEAVQFLRSLYAYAASSDFQPKQTLDAATLDQLLTVVPTGMQALGAKVIQTDSEAEIFPAAAAIDGDPDSFWNTRWGPIAPLPHFLVIDLGKSVAVKGITYLPRQDSSVGRIKGYKVYVGESPTAFGEPAATGEFPNTRDLQKVNFAYPMTGRYLKLEALSAVDGQQFTSVGDLDITYDSIAP
jgi:hypothetical protein